MKPKREIKCVVCGDKFIRWNTFQKVCQNPDCIIANSKKIQKKNIAKEKREFRSNDKPTLRRDCQKIANRLGKLHNMIKGHSECVTCGGFNKLQMDGGHCFPTSTYSPIRYYTLQIRPQCVKDNRFNGGMPTEFKAYLVKELGKEKVEWLESHKGQITKKFTTEYLKKYKKVMGKRLKQQEKLYKRYIL